MSLLWKLPPFYSTAGRGCCRVWWGMAACGVQTPGCVNIQALCACGGRVHSSASTRHLLLLHYNPHALAHGAVHRIASTRHCRIVKRPRRGRIHIQPHVLAHGVFSCPGRTCLGEALLWELSPFYSTAGRGCGCWRGVLTWGMGACGVQTPGCVNVQALCACGGCGCARDALCACGGMWLAVRLQKDAPRAGGGGLRGVGV